MTKLLCKFMHKKGRYLGKGKVTVTAQGLKLQVPGAWFVYECSRCNETFSTPHDRRENDKPIGVTKDVSI